MKRVSARNDLLRAFDSLSALARAIALKYSDVCVHIYIVERRRVAKLFARHEPRGKGRRGRARSELEMLTPKGPGSIISIAKRPSRAATKPTTFCGLVININDVDCEKRQFFHGL